MRLVLSLFLMGVVSTAHARSITVLPLEPGAGSESFEGLGLALSGLIVSDLVHVDGLEVVERAKLDVLLAEVELGSTGYLDPSTAQSLGKGVGAEWAVVGSWSVVGSTFVMDVRAVDVETGEVESASHASGTISDFLTVEKTAVESLLQVLEVEVSAQNRRVLLGSAPTEDFEAIQQYGAGLHSEQQGDYAAAKRRFEAAVAKDPGFDAPGKRLAAILSKLASLESQRVAFKADAKLEAYHAALAATPDEMSLSGRTVELDAMATLAIRFALLESLGRRCQAREEMAHFLERHEGELAWPEAHPAPYNAIHNAGFRLGLYPKAPSMAPTGSVWPPRGGYRSVVDDAVSVGNTHAFVLGIFDGPERAWDLGGGLLNLTLACAAAETEAQLSALETLGAQLRRLGIEKAVNGKFTAPLGVEFEIAQMHVRAVAQGIDAADQSRLLALSEEDFGEATSSVQSSLKKLVRAAERAAIQREQYDHLEEESVMRMVLSIVKGESTVPSTDAWCHASVLHPNRLKRMAKSVSDIEENLGRPPRERALSPLRHAMLDATLVRLAGCLEGEAGLVRSYEDARAWAATMPARARPSADPKRCEPVSAELRTALEARPPPSAERRDQEAVWWMHLAQRFVTKGCATYR